MVESPCLHVLYGHKRPLVADKVSQKPQDALGPCFLNDYNLLQDLSFLILPFIILIATSSR